MPLTLDTPGATREQLARGVDMAHQVFAAAGIDARAAWDAYCTGMRGEAWSTWFLAQVAALDACARPAESGHLRFADDD
jgi:hypothetical protein